MKRLRTIRSLRRNETRMVIAYGEMALFRVNVQVVCSQLTILSIAAA